ncbi:MAG: TIGR02680 family protein [Microthrixaceae bacterium]
MSDRWVLNRAGILNVYQYGDEVLHFSGGRLLLRGVNGSGKSTAMNMLLPFLLDADTRRIDAAGVQSGVLRSWMLTGREEPQPIGYLWLELRRGDEYIVFGCGIRANRSTDNVSTWWFVTDRRPHVDINLIEGRTPRSIDSLRDVLGAGSQVFTKEQRSAYRAELRSRLYGGADLDQHIRLLHVLRNPTVGDRIDSELERYLDEALPQLSEQAIDDAAQPLEDLEEHRDNVAQLGATDEAIRALAATYTNYARCELHAAGVTASEEVKKVVDLRRQHGRLLKDASVCAQTLENARTYVSSLEDSLRRLQSEIDALKDQPLYREGKDLEDLRDHVSSLADQVENRREEVERTRRRRDKDLESEKAAAATANGDHETAGDALSHLRSALSIHNVNAVVADLEPCDFDVDGRPPVGLSNSVVPTLGAVTIAIRQRESEVDSVRERISAVETAQRWVQKNEADVSRSQTDLALAAADLDSAVQHSREATDALHAALTEWVNGAGSAAAAMDIQASPPPVIATDTDIRGERVELRGVLLEWMQQVQNDLNRHLIRSEETARAASDIEEQARVALAELLDRSEPDPPSLAWQTVDEHPRLAALVDFRDDVPHEDRLGLEAALEASGLLAATVRPGEIRLATGDLVALGGPAVANPLSDSMVVTLPEAAPDGLDVDWIRAVLDTISTDFDSDADTAVSADGRFRVGSLSGRHHRDQLELIGVTARRAALERQRDQAKVALVEAEEAHASAVAKVDSWTAQRDTADLLAKELPSTEPLDRALLAEATAADLLVQRTDALSESESALANAQQQRDDLDDALRRESASLQLPRTETELKSVEGDLRQAGSQVETVRHSMRTLDRSLDVWRNSIERLAEADNDFSNAQDAHGSAVAEHQPQAARLATLEDALGADYQQLLDALKLAATEFDQAEKVLPGARHQVEEQVAADAAAKEKAEAALAQANAAETGIVAQLDRLRSVLDIPGLWLAAVSTPDAVERSRDATAEASDEVPRKPHTSGAPAVERSSAGVDLLAKWILNEIPPPTSPVNAESVRMSLLHRRNTLGNGWDAEDRRPDDSLPLSIEVNGPEGRFQLAEAARVVSDRLRQQQSLLDAKQTQALRNLLQGLIAKEIASKFGAARELIDLMNVRLKPVETAHGIGVSLQWRRREDLDADVVKMIELLSRPPDLRTSEDDDVLIQQISRRIDDARAEQPEAAYRDLISEVLDYRRWHQMRIMLHRPNQSPARLGRRTALSEGEKKVVSYLPLFAAVAASCDALAEGEPSAPRFVLLDDAFAKVSVDNHEKLFGLLVEMDLDFIATSERLWGTHASVPELAITEVIRDADAGVILLEHSHWNGTLTKVRRSG